MQTRAFFIMPEPWASASYEERAAKWTEMEKARRAGTALATDDWTWQPEPTAEGLEDLL